jgi:hypothetical protein
MKRRAAQAVSKQGQAKRQVKRGQAKRVKQPQAAPDWALLLAQDELLERIVAHAVGSSPAAWLHVQLVCKRFQSFATRSAIQARICRVLCSRLVDVMLTSPLPETEARPNSVVMPMSETPRTTAIMHRGMRTPLGYLTEGRRATDGALLYSIGPALERDALVPPVVYVPQVQIWLAASDLPLYQFLSAKPSEWLHLWPDGRIVGAMIEE